MNIRCGQFWTCPILLATGGVRTRVLTTPKTRFCQYWPFGNCYLLGALRFCKTCLLLVFDSGNSSPLFWGAYISCYLCYFWRCSISVNCYLLQVHWEWSKVSKSGVFGVISVISCVSGVEVWCTESLLPRGRKDTFWQPDTENTKSHENTRKVVIPDTLTDVLTCVKVVISVLFQCFAISAEPAGFTYVFMNINGISDDFRKTPVMTRLWHRYWPPGDTKGSVLTSLTETGRKPPRTESHGKSCPAPSTIDHH